MARKGLKRITDGGTVTVTPSSTEDLLTNPAIDEILQLTDAAAASYDHSIKPAKTTKIATNNPTGPISVVETPTFDTTPKIIQTGVVVPTVTDGRIGPLTSKVAKMQTIKLGSVPTDVSVNWGSHFDPNQCSVFLHRVSVTSNPTGHLSSPVFEGEAPINVKFRMVRDNTPVPEGSVYLGSYSDVHVGPAMQALHVFLLP